MYPHVAFLVNGDGIGPSLLGLEHEGEQIVESLNDYSRLPWRPESTNSGSVSKRKQSVSKRIFGS
jgi:hypothetical protein